MDVQIALAFNESLEPVRVERKWSCQSISRRQIHLFSLTDLLFPSVLGFQELSTLGPFQEDAAL